MFQVFILLVLLLLLLSKAVKKVKEDEVAVIFRLGRAVGAKGPGIRLIIPIFDYMLKLKMDHLRGIVTMDVPSQEIITRDNVLAKINAVVYFQVMDLVKLANYFVATSQIAQTALRSVLGQAELDELLSKRDKINQTLQKVIDDHTEPWGIKVTAVEIKDVERISFNP